MNSFIRSRRARDASRFRLLAGAFATSFLLSNAGAQAPSATDGPDIAFVRTPGHIDTSFGKRGTSLVPVGPTDDHAEAMVVQPDGRIVVAGWGNGAKGYAFELIRLQRDGRLDPSFGTGGRVIAPIGGGADEVHAMALQPDGRIVVAGTMTDAQGNHFALARFLADGSLDPSFGQGGQVVTSFGSASDEAFAVVVQPDGRIVAGGHTHSATRGIDFALARYESDGSPDLSFGDRGLVVTPLHALDNNDSIYALALQFVDDEWMIVAAGGEGDFTLHRYHADGRDDSTFGIGQHPEAEFGSVIGAARALAVDSHNRVVAVGHVDHDFAMIRLTPDGLADESFGASGRVKTAVSAAGWDEAQAVVVQAGDQPVVAGWAVPDGSSAADSVVARYTSAGVLDATFGKGGLVVRPVAPNGHADEARAVALQVDDRLHVVRSLLAGSASVSDQDFYVMRYWN